jgi:hypothetical protein
MEVREEKLDVNEGNLRKRKRKAIAAKEVE